MINALVRLRMLLALVLAWLVKTRLYQTLETVFRHISKRLQFRQKSSATRRIFNSLLDAWKCNEMLCLVFLNIYYMK